MDGCVGVCGCAATGALGECVLCVAAGAAALPLLPHFTRTPAPPPPPTPGLTASTGDLADNHDVLSLLSGPENEAAPSPADAAYLARPEFVSSGNPAIDDSVLSAVGGALAECDERLAHVRHDVEHALAGVEDSLKATLKRLESEREDNTRRIVELERRIQRQVANDVQGAVDNSLAGRLARLEGSLSEKVTAAGAAGRSFWLLPFALLAAALLGLAAVFYRTYRHAKKTHLL